MIIGEGSHMLFIYYVLGGADQWLCVVVTVRLLAYKLMVIPCKTTQVMSNQEAVDIAGKIKDPLKAAKQLATEALHRDSKDDISCIVVRFRA